MANLIDLLLKKDYHERPEIGKVFTMILNIKNNNYKEKILNFRDFDEISLNILKINQEKYSFEKHERYNMNNILNLNKGEIYIVNRTDINEEHGSVKFHRNSNVDESDCNKLPLSGILQICLLEFIMLLWHI